MLCPGFELGDAVMKMSTAILLLMNIRVMSIGTCDYSFPERLVLFSGVVSVRGLDGVGLR